MSKAMGKKREREKMWISNSRLEAYRLQARDVTSRSTERTDVSEKPPDSVLQVGELYRSVEGSGLF